MVHRRVAASPSRTTPDQVVHVSTPLRLGDEINASLPPIPVPRQRSTVSASAGMPSLSDRCPFRAAPSEASQDFRARARQRSKKRQKRVMARVARFACHQSSLLGSQT